ncbi:MAG: hypothetical protein ACR2NM_08990, partial [Bythopirellula sp.]
ATVRNYGEFGDVGQAWRPDASLVVHPILTVGSRASSQVDSAGFSHSSVRAFHSNPQYFTWQDQSERLDYRRTHIDSISTGIQRDAAEWISETPAGFHDYGDEPSAGISTFGSQATLTDAFRVPDEVFAGWD